MVAVINHVKGSLFNERLKREVFFEWWEARIHPDIEHIENDNMPINEIHFQTQKEAQNYCDNNNYKVVHAYK